MKKKLKCWLKLIDRTLDGWWLPILLLCLVVVLRLPNFFEPYWYGDEAIYLTVGQSLNYGQQLYSQIIDHKTPIIYYLARVPGQFEFRLLLLGWMAVTTLAFYQVTKKLFKQKSSLIIANLIFVLLTTLPWLEGHIPNGELFVMGFVMVAVWLMSGSELWQVLFEKLKQPSAALNISDLKTGLQQLLSNLKKQGLKGWLQIETKQVILSLVAGVFLGLGILTKVPGLFDALAIMLLSWWLLTRTFPTSANQFKAVLNYFLLMGIGVLIPIFISVVYFVAVGAGRDYLNFGLLYNFHYAGNWGLPFSNPILLALFTLPGKFFIAAGLMLFITWQRQHFSAKLQFILGWLVLALFASLLSNRPYPHYLQQLVPPLSLLVGWLAANIKRIADKDRTDVVTSLGLLGLILGVFLLIGFRPYSTLDYYKNWLKLVSNQQTAIQYRDSFNWLMPDNYKAAAFFNKTGSQRLFIWGTNPALYALSKTVPVGRFTVSFHIIDISAYDETMANLRQTPPPFIVVMDDEKAPFPEFYRFLEEKYVPVADEYRSFTIYRYLNNGN